MALTLLALDIASVTGFAYGDPVAHRIAVAGPLEVSTSGGEGWVKPRSGFKRIAPVGAHRGEAFHFFSGWIGATVTMLQPDWIFYEAPIMGGGKSNFATVRLLTGFASEVERLAYALSLPLPIQVQNGTIKKHWAGTGRAEKTDMVGACRARGWKVSDHNEADALGLFDFAASRIQAGEWPR